MSIDSTIMRIRRFAEIQGWSKTRFALEAGIQDTVLRNITEKDWNPTANTLRRLEKIIPEDFAI